MKIVLAPDSFKGSMSSIDIIKSMKGVIEKVFDDVTIVEVPIADGGEGTIDAVVHANKGTILPKKINDPLGRTIDSHYGVIGQTAVVEMALCSGLTLMNEKERNPMLSSSIGTGQMIRHAISDGFRTIVIGIGGSGTNDGGTGAMQALGAIFYDKEGNIIPLMTGKRLIDIDKIDTSNMYSKISKCNISVMCDVTNPLTGEHGATYVYGPQKGASESDLEILEAGMKHYEQKLKEHFGKDIGQLPGAGAAGGIGAALVAFLGAELVSGIDEVLTLADFETRIEGANLIITGEGRVDSQSASGKVIHGVTQAANKKDVPVVVIAGGVGDGIEAVYDLGVKAILTIPNKPMSLDEAMNNTKELIENCVYNLCQVVKL